MATVVLIGMVSSARAADSEHFHAYQHGAVVVVAQADIVHSEMLASLNAWAQSYKIADTQPVAAAPYYGTFGVGTNVSFSVNGTPRFSRTLERQLSRQALDKASNYTTQSSASAAKEASWHPIGGHQFGNLRQNVYSRLS